MPVAEYQPFRMLRFAGRALSIAAFLAPIALVSGFALYGFQNISVGGGTVFGRSHLTDGLVANRDSVANKHSPDTITIELTTQQAKALLGVLQNALDERDPPQPHAAEGGSHENTASSRPDRELSSSQATGLLQRDARGKAFAYTFSYPNEGNASRPVATPSPAADRLPVAIPLLLAFVGATSLVVILMICAGVVLIRAGGMAGGAKMEILGMKIDAKGGGVAAIACASVVLLATFRPLIDAVVALSRG